MPTNEPWYAAASFHARNGTWAVGVFRNASHFRNVRSHVDTRRASNDFGVFPRCFDDRKKSCFFFDFDENVGKCEIYLCLSRNGLPNRENLLMCEHLQTCAKEPSSLTFFRDHRSHTLRVSAHLTPWKWCLHDPISIYWVSLTKNIFENVFLELILQQFEVRTSPYFGVFACILEYLHAWWRWRH